MVVIPRRVFAAFVDAAYAEDSGVALRDAARWTLPGATIENTAAHNPNAKAWGARSLLLFPPLAPALTVAGKGGRDMQRPRLAPKIHAAITHRARSALGGPRSPAPRHSCETPPPMQGCLAIKGR